MTADNRIAWIDNAKGIGILLVVLGHNPLLGTPELNWLHELIFLFHMPLFFLLSGWVHKNGALLPHLQGRIRSVLVPYLVTGLAFILLNHLCHGRPWDKALFQGLILGISPYMPQPQFWFMNVLFACGIATIALSRLTDRIPRMLKLSIRIAAMAAIAFLGLWLIEHNTVGSRFNGPQFVFYVWPWSLDLLPLCLAFYLLGCWANDEAGKTLPSLFRSAWGASLIVLVAAALLFYASGENRADMDLFVRIAFGPWVLPATLAGIALILALSQQAGGVLSRGLRYLGQRSLVIFLFHYLPQQTIVKQLGTDYMGAACGFVAAIALSLALDALIRRSLWLSRIYYPSLAKSTKGVERDGAAQAA
jgi:fucose 4-O-acetylase-like acetyltransferase